MIISPIVGAVVNTQSTKLSAQVNEPQMTLMTPAKAHNPPQTLSLDVSGVMTRVSGGGAYTGNLVASGGSGDYVYSVWAGTLPPNITLNSSSGNISGVFDTPGIYEIGFQVSDGINSDQEFVTIMVDAP